jgi:hypothetical protein
MLAQRPLDRMNARVMEAFGDPVRLSVNGTIYLVDAMHRAPWQGIAIAGHPVDRAHASITISRADYLRSGVASGDTVDVQNVTYRITGVQMDDGGMVELKLGRVRV